MGCGIAARKLKYEISKSDARKSTARFLDESGVELQTRKTGDKKILAPLMMKPAVTKVEDSYKILTRLGKGAFGSVYKVLHKKSNFVRAMKVIKKETLQLQDDDKKFLKEIEILIEADHPNIIKIFEYFDDDINYYLITEYVAGGELYDSIANWNQFNEEKAGYLIYQVLSAVNYLHSKNIIHRDLKPENILVEKTNLNDLNSINIKLIDFGTCNFYERNRKLSLRVGTPYYIAPEVLKKNYNEKADIWSCGVILYILLVGYPPFTGNSTPAILESVKKGKFDVDSYEWSKITNDAKDLVKKMLNYNYEKRISAQEAIAHKWIKKTYDKKITQGVKQEFFTKVLRNIKNFNAREKFQKATLAYIVHFFYSNSEVDDLRRVFQTLDQNGDGRLSYTEIRQGFEKIYGTHLSDSEVANIMESLDQDNKGFVEYAEFLKVTLNQKTLVSEVNLRLAFDKFDLNHDGYLSKSEIMEVFGDSDLDYFSHIMEEIDKNLDGKISYSEFCEMMRKVLRSSMSESLLGESPIKAAKRTDHQAENKTDKNITKKNSFSLIKIEGNKNAQLNVCVNIEHANVLGCSNLNVDSLDLKVGDFSVRDL